MTESPNKLWPVEQALPTYQLTGRAARDLDKLVEEGLQDYRAGRTKTIKSLADLVE